MTPRWLAILILLAPAVARAEETPDQQVLRVLDDYRKAAGLGPVQLDAKLSKGCCMEHAEYMRLNMGTDAMAGLNAHTQRPDLPGASPAGAACGKAADLFPGVASFRAAVDAWMAGFYHRRPILHPALAKIGFGYSKLPDGTYAAALMFAEAKDGSSGWPVAYPANAQTDIPLVYGNEVPNPIPGGAAGGYPITLQFPAFDKLTKVHATLFAGKAPVPFYLSEPEHPATSFGQYGVVSLIAKEPLDPDTTYNVKIDATWQGKRQTWKWSFTTLALRKVDASDDADITRAIDVASIVHGTVTHAGMIDTETVFLALTNDKHRKMVSVVIPIGVWKQLAGSAKPEAFKGRALEVRATPQIAAGKFINLAIVSAKQLKFSR